jgi:hypothetical protein
MKNVIDMGLAAKKIAKQRRSARKKGARQNTMCANGHHKWKIDKTQKFDVNAGRLLTVLRCAHCGKEKTELR